MKIRESLWSEWLEFAAEPEGKRKEELRDVDIDFLHLIYKHPDIAWSFLLKMIDETEESMAQAFLGAGPLESFIRLHGTQYINEIERLSHESRRFRDVCVHVWPSKKLPQGIYDRLMKLKELPLSDEM